MPTVPKIKFIVCYDNMKTCGNHGATEFTDFERAWEHAQSLKISGYDVSLSFLRKGAPDAVTIREWPKVTL